MNRVYQIILFIFCVSATQAQVSVAGCTLSGGMSIYGSCSGVDAANGYSTTTSGIGCTTGCNLTAYSAFGSMCNGSPFNGNCNNATSSGGHQVIYTTYTIPAGCTANVTAEFKPRTGCSNSGVDSGDSLLISGSGGTSSTPNPNSSGGSSNASVVLNFTQTGGSLNIRLRSNRSEEIATWTITLTGSCGTNCSGVLPIQLTGFSAERSEDAVLLKWNVATELNVMYYQLERSTDGVSFTPFQVVPSVAGVSGNINLAYFGKDYEPVKGLNYYRLVNVDSDGSSNYSEMISILFDEAPNDLLDLYTANDEVIIKLSGRAAHGNIDIRDLSGRLIRTFSASNASGIIRFPLSELASGLYFVMLSNDSSVSPKKLIVK